MNDFKILLDAVIDNSSLTEAQKKLAKERFKANLDVELDISKFANQKKKINDDFNELASKIKKAFSDIDIKLNDKQLNAFTNDYINTIKQASKEQEKLNNAQKKSNIKTQEKYYQRIIDNNKKIHNLELKQINAGEKQKKVLQDQIDKLEKRNQYNYSQLDKKGLRNNDLEWDVNNSKLALDNQRAINDAKREDLAISKQIAEVNKIKHSLSVGDYDVEVSSLTSKFQKWGLSVEEVDVKMKELNTSYNNLKNAKTDDQRIQAEKEYQLALEKTNNELKLMNLNSASRADRTNLSNKIQVWLDKNTKASKKARETLNGYIATLSSADEMGVPALQKIKNEFIQIEIAERGAGRLGKSFIDTLKAGAQKFAEWGLASNAVMAVWNKSREMVDAVYDIDTAITELAKVSDTTFDRLNQSLEKSIETAKTYGSTVDEVITATADWSRLGYDMDSAEKLAEIATIYKNVGDGIDLDTANKSLVSTLQGFQLDTDEALHIIDSFNEVANNYAIDSAGIGEALQRSASSMYAAGNTLEETIGLITAANAVVQDPDAIGTAYKTISMRIRGAKTEMESLGLETDGMVESTATLRKEILALSGVDIMQDENTFKSTYDILDELALKWSDLTDIQRATITELIAGKRQGNIVSALMTNFDTARDATKSAINSQGSAMKEQETYLSSLEAKTAQFDASFQSLSNTILDSDLLKWFVDFGTGTVSVLDEIIDKFGVLPTLMTTIGAGLGFKNIGRPKMFGLVLKLPITICVL